MCRVKTSLTATIASTVAARSRTFLMISGSAASPISSDFVRTAIHTAVKARITPMHSVAMPSKIGMSRTWLRTRPTKATISPSIAAVSSKSTTNVVGSFDACTAAGRDRGPWNRRNSLYARYHATPSKIIARISTT